MIDLNILLMALAALIVAWCFDRFVLKRGAVILHSCALYDVKNEYYRFVLDYAVKSAIFWGGLHYSLRDKSNPSTVITGKARTLEHALVGMNHEFLLIKERLTATSAEAAEWELRITASTVVGHFNPLYKYFPLTTSKTFKVVLNEK